MKLSVVKENMSKGLICVAMDAPMEEAASLMEQYRIRHLLVVDGRGGVVGILSDRDVNRAIDSETNRFPEGANPATFMAWPVLTVLDSASLADVAQGMIDEKVSAFLVVTRDDSIVGIITSEDLLKQLVAILSAPSPAERITYSPLIGEFVRDLQSVGI